MMSSRLVCAKLCWFFCRAAGAAVIVEAAVTTRNCGYLFSNSGLAASRHDALIFVNQQTRLKAHAYYPDRSVRAR